MPGGATRENLRVAFHPVSGWQWVSQTRTLHPAEYLKEQLDTYMSQFPKVKILRLKERHGLIRARLAGAEIAKGRTGAVFHHARSPEVLGIPLQHCVCPSQCTRGVLLSGSPAPAPPPAPAGLCQH